MAAKYSGIRESRPYTYNDVGDESVKIAADFEKKCLKNADRTFSQGLQCQEVNSIQTVLRAFPKLNTTIYWRF